MIRLDNATLRRFRRNVAIQADGCWMWTGSGDRYGYGTFTPAPGQPRYLVHRWSYEAHHGPIPEGMQVGHTCHDKAVAEGTCAGGTDCQHRRCVNPAHLEAQTPSENTIAQNHDARNREECPRGHPYDEANTYVDPKGKRRCRRCKSERWR